jgi:hypothetical protein
MKQKLSVITFFLIIGAFLFVCTSSAIPPMPSSGTTYDGTGVNITATSANITTLTAANAVFTASNTTGVMAANVINASGTLTAVPSSTAPIMFGNTTPVNTSTGATFPTATKTQISKVGAFTNAAVGDLIIVTGGTGATTGQYRLTTKTSNDLVVVDRNIHAAGANITDGGFSVFRDIISVGVTDGTNGMLLSNYSHQNKPLQIGGDSFVTARHAVASKDVVVPQDFEVTRNLYGKGITLFSEGNKFLSLYPYPDDGTHFSVNPTDGINNNNIILTTYANIAKDHDHDTASATPTFYYQDNTDPDVSNNKHGSITHNGTDLLITTGAATGAGTSPATIENGIKLYPRGSANGIHIKDGGATIDWTPGATGGLAQKIATGTANITANTTITVSLSIPAGATIIGSQLRVDAPLAAGETWNAAYSGGNAQTIGHEEAVAQNTKVNVPFDGLDTAGTLGAQAAWASPITTATTNIDITKHSSPGVDSFTAQGTITAIVYYETYDTMASTP